MNKDDRDRNDKLFIWTKVVRLNEMLYSDIIWEHYKNPNNFGKPKKYDFEFEDVNAKCGDSVKWFFKIDNDKITDIGFEGQGCALSIAGCSIISEHFKGMALNKISSTKDDDIWKILGFEPYPGRVLCSTLGFSSIRKAINFYIGQNNKKIA